MRKSKSGFTLVELLIVCVIIVVLATISYMAFNGYQNQTSTKRASTMAKIVESGAEGYYLQNGEYPSARQLAGTGKDGTTITDFSSIATTLSTTTSALSGSNWTFTPCVTATAFCAVNAPGRVYYLTKNPTDQVAVSFSLVNGCTITFPAATAGATDAGSVAYATAYLDPSTNYWYMHKSNKGNVTISGTYCYFN